MKMRFDVWLCLEITGPCVGALITKALLFGVNIRGPDFWNIGFPQKVQRSTTKALAAMMMTRTSIRSLQQRGRGGLYSKLLTLGAVWGRVGART